MTEEMGCPCGDESPVSCEMCQDRFYPDDNLQCPECGHWNPVNQRGCNGCGTIYNPPLQSSASLSKEED